MDKLIFFVIATSLLILSRVEASLDRSEFGPTIRALMDPVHSKCIERSGTDQASIDKVIDGEFIEKPEIKVYMRCLLEAIKVLKENGDINQNAVSELLPAKVKTEGLKDTKICEEEVRGIINLEDKAYAFIKCDYEINPDIFIFF